MLIPGPDTRVVELRVHGILGTTPEDLVDAVAAVDVAGDGKGRLVRPADRLRRPAPGPVLKAEGRPLPRTVEGYVWGGLTSGGAAKAIWALLFPFSLANMASWMLPPVADNRIGRTLAMCCRALLRVGALLLTVLLVGQLASVSLDVVAAQCLGPGSTCLGFLPGWVRTAPTLRTIVGLAPILIVVAILHGVSTVNWTVNAESTSPEDAKPRQLSRLPGAALIADPDAPALRTLHLTAALATTVFLALGGPAGPISSVAAVFWSLALALIALALIGVLAFGDPTGARPDRYGKGLRTALRAVPRRLTLAFNLALIVAVVAIRPHLPTRLTDTDLTVQDIAIALGSVCVLLAVLLVPTALLARKQWAGQPRAAAAVGRRLDGRAGTGHRGRARRRVRGGHRPVRADRPRRPRARHPRRLRLHHVAVGHRRAARAARVGRRRDRPRHAARAGQTRRPGHAAPKCRCCTPTGQPTRWPPPRRGGWRAGRANPRRRS